MGEASVSNLVKEFNIQAIRAEFPILEQEINGHPLTYLDSGASAQKPRAVLEAMQNAYAQNYSNVHRGLHTLSNRSTDAYEAVRGKIARFLGAPSEEEIILNSGTTEGINLIAYSWAMPLLEAGDEILLSVMEHHANIVPWHFLRERMGIKLCFVPIEEDGSLDAERMIAAMGPRTKLVAVSHMSNVLGTVVDVSRITEAARNRGIPVLVDGSQAAVHMPVNVDQIGCDFYTITGHKLYGPSGSGAVYVRKERMEEMQPFMGGGDMIREVSQEQVIYADPPMRFEAGTPAIVPIIGFGAALDFINSIGMKNITQHEASIELYASAQLAQISGLNIQGNAKSKGAIFSFTMEGAHPHDLSTILDRRGIAIRAGQHCAGPLMQHLGLNATARASFGMYNSLEDVDRLIKALKLAQELFG